jgi:glycine betaine/choline ABC-type transport system substrate-binding protein
MVGYRCDIQRISFDNRNNLQLKEYYQQVSNELQSQLQQLITQLTKVENEKGHLLESKTATENNLQHL